VKYLDNVDHNSMAAHLTRSECEGFKRCCQSNAVDETNVDMLWKALTVRMERVTLIGKGR